LHKGDTITGYQVTVNNAMSSTTGLVPGNIISSDDAEKSMVFESFDVPDVTTWYLKVASIRQVTLESVTGTFAVGSTATKGSGGDTTTATVFGVVGTIIYIGPSTINGSGAEFADGDSVTAGGASGTISTGGIGTASNDFVISKTTAGGTYRFDTSDATMSGRDFKISTTANGEWGPDGIAGNADDGAEYTTGKTTNGTAGSGGAYVQYDWTAGSNLTVMYMYDGGTGTAGNAGYGGADRSITMSSNFTYLTFNAYNIQGTWVNSTDSFTQSGSTFTVTAQSAGPYGYVKEYDGTTLYVTKGPGSQDFAASDTFKDLPLNELDSRTTCTVSSELIGVTALEDQQYIVNGATNGANEVDRITSLVVGPGESVVINSTTANNSFSLIGFEDNSTAFSSRVFSAI